MEIFAGTILIGLVFIFFVSPIIKGFKSGVNGGKQTIDTSHLPERFIVFDLETTGLQMIFASFLSMLTLIWRSYSVQHLCAAAPNLAIRSLAR